MGTAIVPSLIGAIECTALGPIDRDYMLPLVAMFVLAELRERSAYPAIVRLCRLPEEELDYVLGDVVTERLAQILASVAQGDDTLLRDLVADARIDEIVRGVALQAMACAAVEGDLDRSQFREHLRDILRGRVIPPQPCWVWDEAVCIATDLGFVEMLPDILARFDDGVLKPGAISRAEVIEELSCERVPYQPRQPRRYGYTRDAATELDVWERAWETDEDGTDEVLAPVPAYVRTTPKVGRNDPCPCGSGKKYKKCCLAGGAQGAAGGPG
jgi:hypothetical protein